MWVIYCHLANVWCAGLTEDGEKVKYTVNPDNAVLYSSIDRAKKVFDRLPYVWKPHCEIIEYSLSVKIHNRHFDNSGSK